MQSSKKRIKPPQRVDLYIGKQVSAQRIARDLSVSEAANIISLPTEKLLLKEGGRDRFSVSDIFSLKKELDFDLAPFFTDDGQYFSDVVVERTEMADVVHYFSNIEQPEKRAELLQLIKNASSVF